MFKRILLLPTVFFLVLAVSLWTAPAKAAQSLQVPLNPKTIPQFVDQLPSPHLILDRSLDANFIGAVPALPTLPNATYPVNSIVYLNALSGVNYPGYYKNVANVWNSMGPIELQMTEFKSPVLPANTVVGYTGTWVWGYRDPLGQTETSYIGPVILAKRGFPTEIKFVNNLPTVAASNLKAWKYSTDKTLHWADPLNAEGNLCAKKLPAVDFTTTLTGNVYPNYGADCAQNYGSTFDPITKTVTWSADPIPAVVHLHGGEVPPMLDGGPDSWFTSTGLSGHGYYSFGLNQGDSAPGNYAIYKYPNTQEAAPIWFHDHALGITRLNVYAGLAGGYLINDPALTLPAGLRPYGLFSGIGTDNPLLGDTPIIPLVIQDRMFDNAGDLFFPADSANNILWSPNPDHPYWVPEFVGDTIVVNGKTWPFLSVQARRYRFLFLNGSNARTYVLNIPGVNGMYVIGTDGGYLDKPVPIKTLTIMPGERYDVIIDFAGLLPGNYIMTNSGKTPYPRGAQPAGATLGRIVQFRVAALAPGVVDNSYNPAAVGACIRGAPCAAPPIVRLVNTATGTPAVTQQVTRLLTLNEVLLPPTNVLTDPVTGLAAAYPGGPVEILVNNTKYGGELGWDTNGNPITRTDFTPITIRSKTWWYSELPKEGQTELWEIINLTADAHPIHLHLVQFQLMNRQNFDVAKYSTVYNASFPPPAVGVAPVYIPGFGPPLPYTTGNPAALGGNPPVTPFLAKKFALPAPEEQGWKDTVVVMPGMVTRLMVRWAPTDVAAGTTGYFPFDPNGGHGYVWHCHIIDHEDNEMMRPDAVVPIGETVGGISNPGTPPTRTYIMGTHY